jgi:ABC-2 type transport system permease protein
LKALFIKEFLQIIRDPSTLLITIFLPLLYLFLYGYGVSLDLDHLRIGLVLEDTAPDAIDFATSLTDSPYLDVKIVRDRRELLEDLARGRIRGFVVVPAYFSAFRQRPGITAPIQIIADGSEPNTASFVLNYVQQAFQKWQEQERITKGLVDNNRINLQARYWYNEQLESHFFLLPGALAIIMTLIGTLLTALLIAREWERGTMEALMSTPVTIIEIVIGKLVPYFILGLSSMTICVLLSIYIFGLPLRGSWIFLGIVSSVFLFCALGSGLLISTLSKSQVVASQVAIIAGFLPAYILSGFIFEISSMPFAIQLITYIVPARYFTQALQTLFLVGDIKTLLLRDILPMIAIGTVIFLITARKTVKRLD